jgi:ABC-type bacteriocin/lantibiotic exporter with double-glycine peptidase domain
VLPLFEWFETHGLGLVVRESTWLFPVIESAHLLALCLLGGALLVVDLRLLGVGLTRQSIADVSLGARRWLMVAVAAMIATGLPLFLSEAVKCYYNASFWIKMGALSIALLFTFAVREPFTRRAELATSLTTRAVALVSIALWLTVAAAGRWIGFTA